MGGAGDKKKLRDGRKRAMKDQGARDRKLEADLLRVEAEISKCGGRTSAVAAACFFGSRLPQVLFGILQNDSVQDIAERKALYEATFKLCSAMVAHDDWMALLHHREEDAKGKDATEASPLLDSFIHLDQQAQTLKKRGRNVSGIADDPALVSTALRICSVAEQVAQAQKRYKRAVQRRNQGNRRAAAEGGRQEIQPIKEEYVKSLQDLRFREVRNLPANKNTFCFSAEAKKAGKDNRGVNVKVRSRRLVKEIAAMRTSLPLSWNSSVFVVCDDERIDCFKAMVVPGDDTPYAHAPFLFDIFCDEQYPNKPPQVKLLTTGGGRVRFNPNLYANGKVCLSLLGTWSGPGWDPKESTILQIILSIQSMILGVADPYFNEPGYEQGRGSVHHRVASDKYNAGQRYNTLCHALLPALTHPPKVFEPVLKQHFKLKASAISWTIQTWARSAPPDDPIHDARDRVLRELAKYRETEVLTL